MININDETPNKKKSLGRGIGSLLGGANEGIGYQLGQANDVKNQPVDTTPEKLRIWNIDIEKLAPSPFQPRQEFDKEKINELAKSIKEKGILQPIVARKQGSRFEIIAGERRWRAAQVAGLHTVPIIIKEYDDLETLELALIENIQREDLNPIEEAEAYQKLSIQFELSQQQIADKVGKDRATVANSMRLLNLGYDVRDLLKSKEITTGHAKVLLGVSDEKLQKKLAMRCAKDKLSVRKLETLIKQKQDEADGQQNDEIKSDVSIQAYQALTDSLQKKLSTKVKIEYSSGGRGSLSIQFYQLEQLNEIAERLLK